MANDNCRQPWLVEVPIEPKSRGDRDRLGAALARLAAEDPAFGFAPEPDSEQFLLRGMGEFHLDIKIGILRRDIKVDMLRRSHRIEFSVGALRVAYREKITRTATVDYALKSDNDGRAHLARLKIVCEPLPPDSGFAFENWVIGGMVPGEFLASVERGLESALGAGVIAGHPVVGLKVTLIDGACHPFNRSAVAFEVAAREALREALQKGAPVLLEPVMTIELVTPEDCARLVIGDLNARRGQIVGQDTCGNASIINAKVPLANMFGYAKILRSISQGRATSVMQFDHYAPVPLPESGLATKTAAGACARVPLVSAVALTESREAIV